MACFVVKYENKANFIFSRQEKDVYLQPIYADEAKQESYGLAPPPGQNRFLIIKYQKCT
ncbi:MAG: hypothetical protein NC252_03790 [Roseburia sp.]|nr:hypothetical protein [Roseburia sp.]MCM1420213.1 hypothetical protein [Bacteroides sp.]